MATLKIKFVNFDRSAALETYTRKHIESLMHRLDYRSGTNKSIEVQFKLCAKAAFGSIKNSEVMIHYSYPGLKKKIYVKKNGVDLRQVLIEAIHSTETIIQKASEKAEGGRRTLGKSKKLVKSLE